jgi:hypothetical protein
MSQIDCIRDHELNVEAVAAGACGVREHLSNAIVFHIKIVNPFVPIRCIVIVGTSCARFSGGIVSIEKCFIAELVYGRYTSLDGLPKCNPDQGTPLSLLFLSWGLWILTIAAAAAAAVVVAAAAGIIVGSVFVVYGSVHACRNDCLPKRNRQHFQTDKFRLTIKILKILKH